MAKMSVTEMAKAVSVKHGLTQEAAEAFVTNLFNVINDGLQADKSVKVRGLGTFKIIDVRERESVNVNTGERVTIEGHGKINFTPDPVMRDLVNKPFAKFETVVLNEGVELDELNKVNGPITEDGNEENIEDETDFPIEQAEETPEANAEKSVQPAETPLNEVEEETEPLADAAKQEMEKEVSETGNDISEVSEPAPSATEEVAEEAVTSILNSPGTTSAETVTDETASTNVILPTEKNGDSTSNEAAKIIEKHDTDSEEHENDGYDYDTDIEEPSFYERNKVLVTVSAALLIAVLAFACGYIVGQDMASRPVFKTVKVYNIVKKKPTADTAQTVVPTPPAIDTDNKKPAENVEKDAENKKEEKAATTEDVRDEGTEKQNGAALSMAKRQVKTGAYIITGTEQTITVRKGQTMKKISKLYLGDGMECYIQVHNNVEELSEGMKLKIPKLKLKKN